MINDKNLNPKAITKDKNKQFEQLQLNLEFDDGEEATSVGIHDSVDHAKSGFNAKNNHADSNCLFSTLTNDKQPVIKSFKIVIRRSLINREAAYLGSKLHNKNIKPLKKNNKFVVILPNKLQSEVGKNSFERTTNINRTLLDTNGNIHHLTEQRYITQDSMSYRKYLQQNKKFKAYKKAMLHDIKTIERKLKHSNNLDTIVDTINESDGLTIGGRWSNLLESLFNQPNNSPTISLNKTQAELYKSIRNKVINSNTNKTHRKPNLYNTQSKRVVQSQGQESYNTSLYSLSRMCILGIIPLNKYKRDNREQANWKKLISWCLEFWKAVLLKKWDSEDNNQAYEEVYIIHRLNVIFCFDTEWQTTPDKDANKLGVKIRRKEDVLNISYCIWFPDFPTVKPIKGIIFNDPDKYGKRHPFNLKQFFCTMIDRIQAEFLVPGYALILQKINWLVTGYFLGVDWSVLSGWDNFRTKLTVIDKQYIFTQRPIPFNVKSQSQLRKSHELRKNHQPIPSKYHGIDCSITIRDAGLLAPQGGLRALGDIVNIPKLNTEIDDKKNGKPRGYYKTHMKEYRKDCPERYAHYVLNDAIIPLEYLKVVVSTYKLSWLPFSSFPVTTSNYAMQDVYKHLKSDHINERIFQPGVPLSKIKTNPLIYVRDGYRDVYSLGQDGYYGGFNVAFGSFVTYGNPVDLDLKSAYNTAGNLMPWLDYSAKTSFSLDDIGSHLVDVPAGTNFQSIYNHLKKQLIGFPFVVGVGRASVDYPDSYQGITMTPSRNKDDSPVYVRHVKHTAMTLIDMIDAYEHGAKVKIDSLYIPAQHYDRRNSWAEQQYYFLKMRQDAKNKRDKYAKNSPTWCKYNAMQLLFKLAGNTIYGKSGQSVRPKRTRSYMTDQEENVPISNITDPVIAGTYTGFTRYLAHKLYDAVHEVYKDNCLPLNITTDGYTFAILPAMKFDFEAVNNVFKASLPAYYHQRLKNLDYKAGFERKGNSDDFDKPSLVFNLRTRLNGTVNIDCLNALGGIQSGTYSIKDIFNAVNSGKISLSVKSIQISNLTEMKFGAKNHMRGVMYNEPHYTNIPLQYDCAYKPYKWLNSKWKGYGFTCVPFETIKEHQKWKKHSKILTDRYNIMISKDRFLIYLITMNRYSFYHTSALDGDDYRDKVKAILECLIDNTKKIPRKYKDAYYRVRRSLNADKTIPICLMGVYENQKLHLSK